MAKPITHSRKFTTQASLGAYFWVICGILCCSRVEDNTRSPQEILEVIETKGKEVDEVLAKLKNV